MRRTRVATAGLLATALVGGLAACGESEDDSETLEVWIAFTDHRLDWAQERAEEFNENHSDAGYTVEVKGFDSYETLVQSMQGAVEQGETPGVVQYFEAATQEAHDMVKSDGEPLFTSIEAAIDGRDEVLGEPVVLDDVVDAAREYYYIDGEYFSMPWNTSTTVFYSNQDYMEEAGVEEPPETWQDLEAACEKIMALDDAPEGCVTWPNHGWFPEQAVAAMGGEIADNGNGRDGRAEEVTLNSEEMLVYAEWVDQMAEDDYFYYSGVKGDWAGAVDDFTSQNMAFLMTSSGDASGLLSTAAEAEEPWEVAVSQLPYNGDYDYNGNLIGGATLYLTSGMSQEKQDFSLAFTQYMNNPENAADWHKITGYIPITKEATQLLEDEGWFEENPEQRVATDQLGLIGNEIESNPANAGVLLGPLVAIREEVIQAIEDIYNDEKDPEEALNDVQAEAETILENYTETRVGE